MGRKTLHQLSLQVLHLTEKAVLVTEGLTKPDGTQINHWLPLSQLSLEESDPLEEGKTCTITLPEWLINERGLTID